MAFKRRKDAPTGAGKRPLLGRGGSRDPFEHLQEEREKLEEGEQPWFLADEDEVDELRVEAGISSNLAEDDLADLTDPTATTPVVPPTLPGDEPEEAESTADLPRAVDDAPEAPADSSSTTSVFDDSARPVPPVDQREAIPSPGPTSGFDSIEADRAELVSLEAEPQRADIDETAEPGRQALLAPSRGDTPPYGAAALSEPGPGGNDAAPIFDLPDHSSEPLTSPEPQPAAPAPPPPPPQPEAEWTASEPEWTAPGPEESGSAVASTEFGRPATYNPTAQAPVVPAPPEPLSTEPPEVAPPVVEQSAPQLPISEAQPGLPQADGTQPLERTLVQSFRDVVAQAPSAPPDDSAWSAGTQLRQPAPDPEQPTHRGHHRVEPRKPRRPPRRPQGF